MSGPSRVSAPEAASRVRTVDTLGLGLGPANPHQLLGALGQRSDWEELVVGGALLLDVYELFNQSGVHYRCGFFGPAERALRSLGRDVQLVPGGFRQFAAILAAQPPRVMAVQGAPSDEGGLNLSLHVGATAEALRAAGRDPGRVVVAEVNAQLPVTFGWDTEHPNELVASEIDFMVEVDAPPFQLPEPEPTDLDREIARLARGFIRDGATLQTGIGTIPSMVATLLADDHGGGYGVHSEMFTDGLRRLHQAGKVTNTGKGIFEGRSVATFALGSDELNRWLDHNREVAFLPVSVVNDPSVIGSNRRMVSINGALAVDLYGQVAADAVDAQQVSGVGGHEDFMAGTDLAPDGHSLICLPSTYLRDGQELSRIVTALPAGTTVSTPRHHLDVVITEHGVASVRGLTVRERALALARLAAPDFRADLIRAAGRMG